MSCLLRPSWLFFRASILRGEFLCSITLSVCRSSRRQMETKSVCVYSMSQWVRVGLCVCMNVCACDSLSLCLMWLFRQATHPKFKKKRKKLTKIEWFQMETLCKPQWPIPLTTTHTHTNTKPIYTQTQNGSLSCLGIPYLRLLLCLSPATTFWARLLFHCLSEPQAPKPAAQWFSLSGPFYRLWVWSWRESGLERNEVREAVC